MKIVLYKNLSHGAQAALEDDDDNEVMFGRAKNAQQACIEAARILRHAATKFERLAEEPEPFQERVQTGINRNG